MAVRASGLLEENPCLGDNRTMGSGCLLSEFHIGKGSTKCRLRHDRSSFLKAFNQGLRVQRPPSPTGIRMKVIR